MSEARPSGVELPTFADVEAAAARIAPHAHRTPVMTCEGIDRLAGTQLFFKCENLQKIGAFKFRGATNAVMTLTDEQVARGVATHSSGNHAAALARAAGLRGARAHIVMPENATAAKCEAVAAYGGEITYCEPTLQARESTLAQIVEKTGAHMIHPYNDPRIIAGQGTAALELFEDVGTLDAIVVPVGGGGLCAGTCLSAHGGARSVPVYGAEPAGADDAQRSMQKGEIVPSVEPRTICDGLFTSLGTLTFAILHEHVEQILTVEDEQTIEAMRLLYRRAKTVVEPSGAITLAVVLAYRDLFAGKRIGVVISGGNVDLDRLPWIVSR